MKLSTQVKAVHEENETRTADDNPSHDEKYGVINTEEVRRFEQYYAEIRGGEIRDETAVTKVFVV